LLFNIAFRTIIFKFKKIIRNEVIMNNKHTNQTKALKIYSLIGKCLCGLAGGLAGFIITPIFSLPGILLGIFSGSLLEKYLSPIKTACKEGEEP